MKRELVISLPENPESYRALFENAPVGIGLSHSDGRILAYNESMLKIMGCKPDDIINLNLINTYYNINDRKKLLETYRINGYVRDYEVKLKRKDGTPYYASVSITPFCYNGEDILLTVAVDITEQKETEQALRSSEEKYRTLAENTSDVVYSLNLDGRIVFSSPRVRHYGYEPEALTGKNFLEVVYPDDRNMVASDFEKSMIDKRISPPIEFRILSRNGKIFWLEERSQFNYDARGEIVGMTGIARDITERKKAEEALKKSEERFRKLLERLPDAVALISDNKPVYVNTALLKLFGLEQKEAIDNDIKSVTRFIENPEKVLMRVENILDSGPEYPSEYTAIAKDGTKIPIEVFSRKITYRGKPAILSVIRNLTERKKLELQIHRQNERLKKLVDERSRQALCNERLASAGRLLAGYVHQIGNPIQSIFCCLDRLENMTRGNLELSREVKGIRTHLRRVTDLGRQLKNIYLPQEPDFTLINVNEIVLEVTELYSTRVTDAGIKLRLNLDNSGATAFINETFLYTSLGNLILNALDAMPEGGELTISTINRKKHLQLEVDDTGEGIECSALPKIFKPFYTTKAPDKGTGLGLTLVKEAVEAVGGSITVSSKVGRGTKVIITLLKKEPENFSRRVGSSMLGFFNPQF